MDKHTLSSEKDRAREKERKKKRERAQQQQEQQQNLLLVCRCVLEKKGKRRIEEPVSKRETEQISARKKNRATCSFYSYVYTAAERIRRDGRKKEKNDDAPLLNTTTQTYTYYERAEARFFFSFSSLSISYYCLSSKILLFLFLSSSVGR